MVPISGISLVVDGVSLTIEELQRRGHDIRYTITGNAVTIYYGNASNNNNSSNPKLVHSISKITTSGVVKINDHMGRGKQRAQWKKEKKWYAPK